MLLQILLDEIKNIVGNIARNMLRFSFFTWF